MKPHQHPQFASVLKMAIQAYAEITEQDFKIVAQKMLDGDEKTTQHILKFMEAVA